jgi:hypothetical protein
VTVAQIYRAFVFDPAGTRGQRPDEGIDGILVRAAAGADGALDAPLRSLVGGEAAASSPR